MKYLVENIKPEDNLVNTIQEKDEEGNLKQLKIKGIFGQAEVTNRNNRKYKRNLMEREGNKLLEYIKSKRGRFGNAGHPENPNYNFTNEVCFQLTDYKQDPSEPNNFIGEGVVLKNSIAYNMIHDCNVDIGISSRATGSLKEENGVNIVQDDLDLITFDLVFGESAPEAFVTGIMEEKEWVYKGGILVEDEVQSFKNKIDKIYSNPKSRSELNGKIENLFQDFLNTI